MEYAAFNRTPAAMSVIGGRDTAMSSERAADHPDDDSQVFAGVAGLALIQAIFDHVHFGVAVVGAESRLLFANQAARLECARNPMLCNQRDRIVPAQQRQGDELRRALAAARCGRWSLVQFKTGGDSTLLAVIPLTPFGSSQENAPVLVMFGLRNPSKALAIQFYARSCGMTTTEERVLRAFSDGFSPNAIAHRHEVAISTVRTQLSSIRIKAGACNLRELTRTLGCLPPMMPAARSAN